MNAPADTPQPAMPPSPRRCLISLALGTLAAALAVQAVLEQPQLAGGFVSELLWTAIVQMTGGEFLSQGGSVVGAIVPLVPVLIPFVLLTAIAWPAAAAFRKSPAGSTFTDRLLIWGTRGWNWWFLPGIWFLAWYAVLIASWEAGMALVASLLAFTLSITIAGWATTALTFGTGSSPRPIVADAAPKPSRGILIGLVAAVAIYTLIFTALNWGLWFNLRIPHGDSAMYEEHLWNLTHGKGFRSYLDQGLFLGEHIQVIHLLLVPLHLIWPSHLLLELCESLALASGAIPVFLLARRHSRSDRAGLLLAATYLLSIPVQFLDIAIDLKTFRPIAFGVPLLLWGIERMEQRRYTAMSVLMVLTLSAKEDFALVMGPLGVWLAGVAFLEQRRSRNGATDAAPARESKRALIAGLVLAAASAVYLFLAVKILIPWFRSGDTVHYARYFATFGETPTEILWTMLTRPDLLFSELVTMNSLLYALALLLPLGFLPLFSFGRLAVGLPVFVLLCLNELAQQPPGPFHHFHAPLVPILFWAAAAGLSRFREPVGRIAAWCRGCTTSSSRTGPAGVALFAAFSAAATGLFFGLGPGSIQFWDPGRAMYWQTLYLPGERARQFEKVEPLIPRNARVASTDFVHPRFTHHERSYDYSNYLRRVAGYEDRVPDDTDFIVIDTRHPYSEIHSPEQVRELQEQPDEWELLPDDTDGYFIVLRRREENGGSSPAR
ncbi:hypothetical protein Mal4_44030 [Maioricimonas rarisocia]|uniref:DUF2079 domain-containing protein n=1 Tax=Maioricimonas rarisocia TaxID=2528026 RepID=A0A517ZC73_9PLAN|nr:DUF2079 domain-containing protein [Maioricimonas rarisocia]QDU40049.1 hypothetical protein Mal4_44030 [Maioricimonas rarisocia]